MQQFLSVNACRSLCHGAGVFSLSLRLYTGRLDTLLDNKCRDALSVGTLVLSSY